MNPRFNLALIIPGLFIAAAWFVDPFLLIVFGIAPLVWIGLPTAFIATLFLLVAIRTGRSCRPALITLAVVGGLAAFIALLIPANRFLQELQVSDAKAFSAQVAPLLEAYRQT